MRIPVHGIRCFAPVLLLLWTLACTDGPHGPASETTTPLDTTYRIEGHEVTLSGGGAQQEAAPGSATQITTAIFGEVVSGDLDGDGEPDAALVLVHDPGGSGSFYYIAAAIHRNDRFEGSNAVLLGDRIEPVSVTIENGIIRVVYLDRAPGDPMARPPAIEKERCLVWRNGGLVAVDRQPGERKPDEKITFDLSDFDDDGLYGPPDGRRALSYEFCIPDTEACRSEVLSIDPGLEITTASPGRAGCGMDQALCIGSTHQANFRNILKMLAALPYVHRIDKCFFE